MVQSKGIRKLYTSKGLTPPKGKGLHTYAFHKRATGIMAGNPGYSKSRAYSIAMGTLGRNKSVRRSHWRMSQKRRSY